MYYLDGETEKFEVEKIDGGVKVKLHEMPVYAAVVVGESD